MDIFQPLERIAQEYSTVPMDFNSENDVQARLYEVTREWLERRNDLETTTTKGFDIHLNNRPPSYTKDYHRYLERSVRKQSLTRVRTELPIWHPLSDMISNDERPIDDGEEILDLAVLKSPIDRPIHLENGKHRIELEMIEAAIEIKHPRNHTAMPSNTRGSLDDLSLNDLRNTVDLERLGVKEDLDELEGLGTDYTPSVYFILTSQYDILRRGRTTNQRHQQLGDAAVGKIRNECDTTSVIYAYPGGWEWITKNKS